MLNETQKKLVTENTGLVYSCAKKKHLLNNEDAIQYGMLGLCKAAENYNDQLGIKFSTFATSYIFRWLDGLYSDIKYKNRINDGSIVLVDDVEKYITNFNNSENELDVNHILSIVDDDSKFILKMIYQGYSNKDIYTKLNITSNNYYNRIKKIKEMLNYGRC